MLSYGPGGQRSSFKVSTETPGLKLVSDCYTSQRHSMYPLHAEWWHNIEFCHGRQDSNINMNDGRFLSGGPGRSRGKPTINFTLSIIDQQKAIFSSIEPLFEAFAITDTEFDIEAAKLHSAIIEGTYYSKKIAQLESRLLDCKLKTGNCVLFVGWDPNAGEIMPDGSPRGDLVLEADLPFRWYWDPRATYYKEARWAIRETLQSQEWVEVTFPEGAQKISFHKGSSQGGKYWERALMENVSLSSSGTGMVNYPEGKGAVTIYEYFEKPSRLNPEGRLIVAAGYDSPSILLSDGPNPYGTIPAVLFGMIPVTGRLHFESYVVHLKDAQTMYNRRVRDIDANCRAMAKTKWWIPNDGPPDSEITDAPDGIIRGGNNPPVQLQAMALPPQVFESKNSSMEMAGVIASPANPQGMENATKASSGILLAQIEDREKALIAPLVRSHIECWIDAYELIIKNYKTFCGDDPLKIAWLGPDNRARYHWITSSKLSDNVVVRFTAKEPLPTSRMAKFAMINESMKMLLLNPEDPYEKQAAASAVGLGDLVRPFRDMKLDYERAGRNIMRARIEMAIPTPEIQDMNLESLKTHVDRYEDFMKSPEFEEMAGSMTQPGYDIQAAMRIRQMHKFFKMSQMQMEMQMLQAQMAQQQQVMNARLGQQRAGATAPQGSKGTQGHSGESMKPYENQGGNPG